MNFYKKDAIALARDLETGQGGIEQLVATRPALRHLSQRGVLGVWGMDWGPIFRVVQLVEGDQKKLRREKVVSATLDPAVLVRISDVQPGMTFGLSDVQTWSPAYLRYDIPIDRVIAYVPALIAVARDRIGEKALKKMRFRGERSGKMMSVWETFHLAQGEDEVIADVRSIDHVVGAIGHTTEERLFIEDVLRGDLNPTGPVLEQFLNLHPSMFFPATPMNGGLTLAQAKTRFGQLGKRMAEFVEGVL